MNYLDAVYGPAAIEDPVLVELMQAPAVDRLRGIYQGGISGLLGIAPDFTRFDHSVGVCLLLRRLGAPLLEQIAGLLHDISHTAFSHVADFIFDRPDQSYHEDLYEETLARSDIPAILARRGYDWHDLLDEMRFPLLEQPLPRLCADRLDYFFRDAVGFGTVTRAEVDSFIGHLRVEAGRPVVDDLEAARWAGRHYMEIDDRCWSDLREMSLYKLTAEAIRTAWQAGCVEEADLLGTDWPLWDKLHACPNPAVAAALAPITPATRFVIDAASPDIVVVPKVRSIDPDVSLGGVLRPLSELDPQFAAARAAYLERKGRQWAVRIIKGAD